MRKTISRRKALKATGAALAVSGATATLGFPAMAKAEDTELLARVAVFWKSYEKYNKAHDAWMARRDEIEAMPDYPAESTSFPESDEEHDTFLKRRNEQWDFQKRHGDGEKADASNKAHEQMGAAANAVFAIPAQTIRGAYEKLRMARLATGATTEGGDGDPDLCCYQDFNAPWIDNTLADLERLGGVA